MSRGDQLVFRRSDVGEAEEDEGREEADRLAEYDRPFESESTMLQALDLLQSIATEFAAIDRDPRWKAPADPLPLRPPLELPERKAGVAVKQVGGRGWERRLYGEGRREGGDKGQVN